MGSKLVLGVNDLATKYPEVAKEWHPTLNGDLTPNMVSYASYKKVWWLGSCGHFWDTEVAKRTSAVGKYGCPYCSNHRVLVGYNDMATTHPHIAKEWHPTLNGDLLPTMMTRGSQQKVWWLCPLNHAYFAFINDRTHYNSQCPYCNNKKLLSGYNDLQTRFPEIAAQWHPTLNGELTPLEVMPGSLKIVWWKCEFGHEWLSNISDRAFGGNGCLICGTVSKGEVLIRKILDKYSILNKQQKTFGTCKYKKKLPFDFYLENTNILIEFQGKQHYFEKEFFHREENSFQEQQKRDKIKADWCVANNYELFLLTYLDLNNNLVEEKLLTFLKEKKIIT